MDTQELAVSQVFRKYCSSLPLHANIQMSKLGLSFNCSYKLSDVILSLKCNAKLHIEIAIILCKIGVSLVYSFGRMYALVNLMIIKLLQLLDTIE